MCIRDRAQILWLRQDWLDALNLEAPKTIEELKTVLKAFMDLSLIHISKCRTGHCRRTAGKQRKCKDLCKVCRYG